MGCRRTRRGCGRATPTSVMPADARRTSDGAGTLLPRQHPHSRGRPTVMVRDDGSIEPSTVYSCTIVSTPSPSTWESRKWASKVAATSSPYRGPVCATAACRAGEGVRRGARVAVGDQRWRHRPVHRRNGAVAPGVRRRARRQGRTPSRCPPCGRRYRRASSPRRRGDRSVLTPYPDTRSAPTQSSSSRCNGVARATSRGTACRLSPETPARPDAQQLIQPRVGRRRRCRRSPGR